MRAKRTDANHVEIVEALRRRGYLVQSLAAVGCGVPDLLVWCGRWVLLEVKDGEKCPSARELTPAEKSWHKLCKIHGAAVHVVNSEAEAEAACADVQNPSL